jgi:cytochrome c oxidase subunit 3
VIGVDVSKLPAGEFGSRSTIWWGVLLMIMIESAMFGTLGAGYFYLRLNFPNWPPHGTALPDLGVSTLTMVLLALSVVPMYLADKHAKSEQNDRAMLFWVWVGLAMSVVILVSRFFEFQGLHTRWNQNAYGSIVWFIIGVHTGHIIASSLETLVLALHLRGRPIIRKHRIDVHVDGVYWYFVVAAWAVFYVIVYWSPRWI